MCYYMGGEHNINLIKTCEIFIHHMRKGAVPCTKLWSMTNLQCSNSICKFVEGSELVESVLYCMEQRCEAVVDQWVDQVQIRAASIYFIWEWIINTKSGSVCNRSLTLPH